MSGSSRLRTHQRFLSRRVKSEESSAKAEFMLPRVHSPPPIRGWPVHLHRTLLLMEAEYKVCGITGLCADCCVLFVVRQPPAGKSKVQIYKALKSNKESTAATLKASLFFFNLFTFFCVFVCLVGFLRFSHSRWTPLSCSGPLINQSAFSRPIRHQHPATCS